MAGCTRQLSCRAGKQPGVAAAGLRGCTVAGGQGYLAGQPVRRPVPQPHDAMQPAPARPASVCCPNSLGARTGEGQGAVQGGVGWEGGGEQAGTAASCVGEMRRMRYAVQPAASHVAAGHARRARSGATQQAQRRRRWTDRLSPRARVGVLLAPLSLHCNCRTTPCEAVVKPSTRPAQWRPPRAGGTGWRGCWTS